MDLTTPISELSRVGKTTAKRLEHLGVKNARDLLYYFPFRYEDYRQILPISQLRVGQLATICVQVELIANKRSFRSRKTITEALVSDKTGSLRVVWFNQPFLIKNIHAGEVVYFSGKVKSDMLGTQLVSPTYEKFHPANSAASSVIASQVPRPLGINSAIPLGGSSNHEIAASADANHPPRNDIKNTHTARLVPIYPTTYGLTQKQIRFLVSQAVSLADKIGEWFPQDILEQADLAPLSSALRGIHFPADENNLKLSADRLKFDELFLVQLRAELSRQERGVLTAPIIHFKKEAIKKFVVGLPFVLTKSQKISAWEILQDIAKSAPMNRLLSGDVGSGKTVVAAIAMYNNFLNGYQSALMAPTEILAEQHYDSLVKLFKELDVTVGLLTGSHAGICHCEERSDEAIPSSTLPVPRDCFAEFMPRGVLAMTKKTVINQMIKGKIDVVVGTHALLGDKIKYKDLALVVVDEQHRFGVEQRKAIKEKVGVAFPDTSVGMLDSPAKPQALGKSAHFLSMTATPIPRSLALMIYGDLDISIINELPPGRKKIITKIVGQEKRTKAYDFIRDQVKLGRQVFVICPLIEADSEDVIPAESGNPDNSIGHWIYPSGHSKPNQVGNDSGDKKSVLKEYEKLSQDIFPDLRVGYLHGKLKANDKQEIMAKFKTGELDLLVSTSVIEVGIDIPNASVMMVEGAENFGLAQLHQFRGRVGRAAHQSYCLLFYNVISEKSKERLEFFEQHHDGFKLAEKDLAMRGPGEVYGTQQSGETGLHLAKLTDHELIKKARQAAQMVAADMAKYPEILAKIKDWERIFHLE